MGVELDEEDLSDCTDQKVICVMSMITLTSSEVRFYLPSWRWDIADAANYSSVLIILMHFLLVIHC